MSALQRDNESDAFVVQAFPWPASKPLVLAAASLMYSQFLVIQDGESVCRVDGLNPQARAANRDRPFSATSSHSHAFPMPAQDLGRII